MLQKLICVVFIIPCAFCQESWTVNIEYGSVRGYWSESFDVWQFLGIPYAAPPTGELRFKAPVPPSPWTEILDATNDSIECLQTEDCLVINVFAPPSARDGSALPVLVFMHGGGFTFGSGNGYNPYWTTRHDVILVTFNYRLGTFGYLCTGTESAPGNAGLKDHIEVLRWINRNIAIFGGDADKVTIYGESAGAINAEALVFSRASQGLFHRAIIESGSALLNWAYNYNRLFDAKALGNSLSFSHLDDLDRLTDFLQTVPESNIRSNIVSSSLCVERKLEGVEAAVDGIFKDIVENGDYAKVPIMFAYSDIEAVIFGAAFSSLIPQLDNNFSGFLPGDLLFPSEIVKEVEAQRVKTLYFGSSPITNDSIRNYIDYQTDTMFFNGMYRSAIKHAEDSDLPVYLMEFSHRGGFNQPNILFPDIIGAGHADIVAHVMDLGHYNNDTLAEDQMVRDRMTEMWTNFVKYGDPTPENSTLPTKWLPFTPEEQNYLSMNQEMIMRQFPVRERAQLWVELYDSYYYPPPLFENSAQNFGMSILVIFWGLILNYSL